MINVNEYKPDVVLPPGVTLQETIDTLGMTKAELAERIGMTPKGIGDIINNGKSITTRTALQLEKALGIPAGFWNNLERHYREHLARVEEKQRLGNWVDWLKELPVRAMIKAGLIQPSKDKTELVEQVLKFFGVASPEQWKELWLSPEATYRKARVFNLKPEANAVWLRRGELQAQKIQCEPYDKEAGSFKAALKEIRRLTQTSPQEFQQNAGRLCAQAGVAVVFTPPIAGAPVYGVARWLTPDKALIQLSLRGKWEDMLWFTFFHEAAHILLHGKSEVFVDDMKHSDEYEEEANRFASDYLIPPNKYKEFVDKTSGFTSSAIMKFADSIDISPAVVVGRLRHDKYLEMKKFNYLRRRFEFARRQ